MHKSKLYYLLNLFFLIIKKILIKYDIQSKIAIFN